MKCPNCGSFTQKLPCPYCNYDEEKEVKYEYVEKNSKINVLAIGLIICASLIIGSIFFYPLSIVTILFLIYLVFHYKKNIIKNNLYSKSTKSGYLAFIILFFFLSSVPLIDVVENEILTSTAYSKYGEMTNVDLLDKKADELLEKEFHNEGVNVQCFVYSSYTASEVLKLVESNENFKVSDEQSQIYEIYKTKVSSMIDVDKELFYLAYNVTEDNYDTSKDVVNYRFVIITVDTDSVVRVTKIVKRYNTNIEG